MRPAFGPGAIALTLLLLLLIPANAIAAGAEHGVGLRVIAAENLPNSPGNTLTAVLVQLAPGASAAKHHHADFVFAYVLSGTIRSRLNRGAVKDYTPRAKLGGATRN
jgi:quercetin dioxygenase-like cupin family protein